MFIYYVKRKYWFLLFIYSLQIFSNEYVKKMNITKSPSMPRFSRRFLVFLRQNVLIWVTWCHWPWNLTLENHFHHIKYWTTYFRTLHRQQLLSVQVIFMFNSLWWVTTSLVIVFFLKYFYVVSLQFPVQSYSFPTSIGWKFGDWLCIGWIGSRAVLRVVLEARKT